MNCDDFLNEIDDYLDARLPPSACAEVQTHLASCPSCQRQFNQAQALQAKLKAYRVPPMSPGFAQRAIKNAATQQNHHRRGFVAGFSSAVAAGLALALVIGGLLPSHQPVPTLPTPVAEITLSVEQVQMVNLVFDSNTAVANAELSLSLPEHVELSGYPGQRSLSWSTSLKQGRNVLSLPIKGLAQNQGELVAQINSNGKIKSIRIHLQVTSPLSSQLEIINDVTT